MNPQRRELLGSFVKTGALAAAAPFLIRNALALGDRIHTQGINKLEGAVQVNDKPAAKGMLINPGDKITTGDNSLAIFVVERDVYMLKSNSKLLISSATSAVKTLNMVNGKMLSVFGKGEKKIIIPTATIGIRGTAIYAEADPVRSYLCTCYGTVDIQSSSNPTAQETIVTKKHDAPRYIYAKGEQLIAKAPVINHTDDELFMLEAMVGRMPGFFSPTDYQGGSSY